MKRKFILPLVFASLFIHAAYGKSPSVHVDPLLIGDWKATEDCEKHPSWPSELKVFKDPKSSAVKVKRGNTAGDLNLPGEIVEKDAEGVLYRTIRLPESFNHGKQIVVGSIWKAEQSKKGEKALSIIMHIYKLIDESTLVYEKFGFESEERPGDLMVQPYSKSFPKNYHCVFKRISTK